MSMKDGPWPVVEYASSLRTDFKRLFQALRNATPEVMNEIAEIDARFAYIEACGTSREDALKMARICAQLGLTPADIEPMARNWVINPPKRA